MHYHLRFVGFWSRPNFYRPIGSDLIFSFRFAWWHFQLFSGACKIALMGNNPAQQRSVPSFPVGAADRTAAPSL